MRNFWKSMKALLQSEEGVVGSLLIGLVILLATLFAAWSRYGPITALLVGSMFLFMFGIQEDRWTLVLFFAIAVSGVAGLVIQLVGWLTTSTVAYAISVGVGVLALGGSLFGATTTRPAKQRKKAGKSDNCVNRG